MDLGSSVIVAIILVICVAPFVMMNRNKVKKEKKMLSLLHHMAQAQNCTITQHEYCGNFVIGLDPNKKHVFFYKQQKETVISQFVNLSEIKKCETIKSGKSLDNKDSNITFIEKIELNFISINKENATTQFELYDEEHEELSDEIVFSKKWATLINNVLIK